jgi:hypothetical protein
MSSFQMYSWLVGHRNMREVSGDTDMAARQMAPEALPPGYRRFVTGASRVAEPSLPVNLSVTRTGTFDPAIARKSLTWKAGATPHNAALIQAYANNADKGNFGPPFAPCEVVHPWIDNCRWVAVDRWQAVFRSVVLLWRQSWLLTSIPAPGGCSPSTALFTSSLLFSFASSSSSGSKWRYTFAADGR